MGTSESKPCWKGTGQDSGYGTVITEPLSLQISEMAEYIFIVHEKKWKERLFIVPQTSIAQQNNHEMVITLAAALNVIQVNTPVTRVTKWTRTF